MCAVDPKHAVHSMRAVDPNPFKATTFPRLDARRGSQARRAFMHAVDPKHAVHLKPRRLLFYSKHAAH
jgi:hypothetical protein